MDARDFRLAISAVQPHRVVTDILQLFAPCLPPCLSPCLLCGLCSLTVFIKNTPKKHVPTAGGWGVELACSYCFSGADF